MAANQNSNIPNLRNPTVDIGNQNNINNRERSPSNSSNEDFGNIEAELALIENWEVKKKEFLRKIIEEIKEFEKLESVIDDLLMNLLNKSLMVKSNGKLCINHNQLGTIQIKGTNDEGYVSDENLLNEEKLILHLLKLHGVDTSPANINEMLDNIPSTSAAAATAASARAALAAAEASSTLSTSPVLSALSSLRASTLPSSSLVPSTFSSLSALSASSALSSLARLASISGSSPQPSPTSELSSSPSPTLETTSSSSSNSSAPTHRVSTFTKPICSTPTNANYATPTHTPPSSSRSHFSSNSEPRPSTSRAALAALKRQQEMERNSQSASNNTKFEKLQEIFNNVMDNGNDMVILGFNGTSISGSDFRSINWNSSGASITRKILMILFDRETLATHTLTGKPSPAFIHCNKPPKGRLDAAKVEDIIHFLTTHTEMTVRDVKSAITTKCADECKMQRIRNVKSVEGKNVKHMEE